MNHTLSGVFLPSVTVRLKARTRDAHVCVLVCVRHDFCVGMVLVCMRLCWMQQTQLSVCQFLDLNLERFLLLNIVECRWQSPFQSLVTRLFIQFSMHRCYDNCCRRELPYFFPNTSNSLPNFETAFSERFLSGERKTRDGAAIRRT